MITKNTQASRSESQGIRTLLIFRYSTEYEHNVSENVFFYPPSNEERAAPTVMGCSDRVNPIHLTDFASMSSSND